MSDALALIRAAPTVPCAPWPRHVLTPQDWRALVAALAARPVPALVAMWAGTGHVHALFRDVAGAAVLPASVPVVAGAYPALSPARPAAAWFERMILDLWGHAAENGLDARPWLDHGHWTTHAPLSPRPVPVGGPPEPPSFLPAAGVGLHVLPLGPVPGGIAEPAHLRVTAQGETVVRLEERLGYLHKGIHGLMAGKPLAQAARLAGRISGDSTVAYALAFARAVEAATGCEVPARAHWLRALMAELERIANHVVDIGAICNDAAFAMPLAHMSELREKLLRANALLFGHRLSMDCVVPGGVACDLDDDGIEVLRHLLSRLRKRFEKGVGLYSDTPSLLDRTTGTGVVSGSLAHRFGAGGFVGRAASRSHDARKVPGYPPYDDLDFAVPVMAEGDVHARVMVRVQEVRASLGLIDQILAGLPGGACRVDVPRQDGEGLALVEGFRGEVAVWVRLDGDGRVAAAHFHDPSWFQWPLLEAAIEGNIVADFPLCNKSFNCAYSGVDL